MPIGPDQLGSGDVCLPFLVADLVQCREQRAIQRESRKALRELSRDDRHRVGRAFRRGEAIAEERLVAPALAWAKNTELATLLRFQEAANR